MKYTRAFINTQKEVPKEIDSISNELATKAGITHQIASGHYTFSPIGNRIITKIENIVRKEMNYSNALEIRMPMLQPATLWQETGRWEIYGDEMFKLKNRNNRDFCLGPTHEEIIVDYIRKNLKSYKGLPLVLYQISTKFRDELRPRNGLVRAREFMMKDAYSFDVTEEGLDTNYEIMKNAYKTIFEQLKLKTLTISADNGEIGGNYSEEFIAVAKSGEDKFIIDNSGIARKITQNDDVLEIQTGIEVGHIFKLGTKYSQAMNLKLTNKDGQQTPVIMGCYGIGISRLLSTIIEQHHDNKGIVWPQSVAPYNIEIIPINNDPEIINFANKLEKDFESTGIETLYDDREISPGIKFKDSDLIGIPYKVIIGKKSLENQTVEIENRRTYEKIILNAQEVVISYNNFPILFNKNK